MNKILMLLAVITFFLVLGLNCIFANEIFWDNISGENSDLKAIQVSPVNPEVIFFGSNKGVFKSDDSGLNWRRILAVTSENMPVNFLLVDQKNKNQIYATSGNGLFYSANLGKSWQKIFQGKSLLETDCTALEVSACGLYLGTCNGLFISNDRGRIWQKPNGILAKSRIVAIARHPTEENCLYIACADGLLRTQNCGQSWEKIYVANPKESVQIPEELLEGEPQEIQFSEINYISVDPGNPDYLYLATVNGIFKSTNKGTSWDSFSSYGLLDKDVRFIKASDKSKLFACTKSAIFIYQENSWHEISQRLLSGEIRSLYLDNESNLYAACAKGLFKCNLLNLNIISQEKPAAIYTQEEPSINDVQQAAISYAEVEPGKIKKWRNLAAKRAWLPELSIGANRDTADLRHWEGGSTTKPDDDQLRTGKDTIEWDINLKWDLSELIWTDAETSIDVRSRLLVELRENILDQVTKLYFERMRLKLEIDCLAIEERKKRIDKELKVRELTAYLDGLTGGYFSSHLNPQTGP